MMTPLQKKWAAKRLDADDIYNKDKGSITFIYDPRKDKLYAAPYDATHYDIPETHFSPDEMRELVDKHGGHDRPDLLEAGYILGRMGHVPSGSYEDTSVIPLIAFWNMEFTNAQIKRTLQKLAEAYPDYFIANPDEIIVTGEEGEGVKTSFLSTWGVTFGGGQYQKKEDSPECQAIGKMNIKGQNLTLQDILGKIHQTRGQEGPELQAGFCAAYPSKKRAAQDANCDLQSKMLDSLSGKLKCGEEDYTKFKQAGRQTQRQEFRKFIEPEPEHPTQWIPGTPFRTSKRDIDAKWRELMYGKKSEHFSFKEWLNAQ